jgi:putative aldouronate transport system substrate-binding protein
MKKLMEKVNAKLDIYWIEWTDYLTNYNLTLAANDGSVDLVGTATTWLDAWPNAKRGAFLELTEDMLKQMRLKLTHKYLLRIGR